MDNRFCQGALLTIGKNMGHDIVSNFLFLGLGNLKINVVSMCLKLSDHLAAHSLESHFILSLGQGDPATPPVGEFVAF